MKHIKNLLLALAGTICLACIMCACSESGSNKSDKTYSESSDSGESDAKRQAEIERLTGLEKKYTDTVDRKDDWADGLVYEALKKLADEGSVSPVAEGIRDRTDIPAAQTTDPTGKVLSEKAIEYIDKLLCGG